MCLFHRSLKLLQRPHFWIQGQVDRNEMERTMCTYLSLFRLKTSLTTWTHEDQSNHTLTFFPDKPTEAKSFFTAATGMSLFHTLTLSRTLNLPLSWENHTFTTHGIPEINMQVLPNFTLDFCSWQWRALLIRFLNQKERLLSRFSRILWADTQSSSTCPKTWRLNSRRTNEW